MITKENIETAKKIYSQLENWNFANKTLTEYFNNKSNNSKGVILIKVLLVDGLYKTNLKDQISVANHISKIENLDNRLIEGKAPIVKDIANWKNKTGKVINILSFSSKFCHFHNKSNYPIYDSYVCTALKTLVGWKNNKNYEDFKEAINKFREDNKIADVSFEDMDKFLWLYGMLDKIRKGKRDINKEIFNFYWANKKLFESLSSA